MELGGRHLAGGPPLLRSGPLRRHQRHRPLPRPPPCRHRRAPLPQDRAGRPGADPVALRPAHPPFPGRPLLGAHRGRLRPRPRARPSSARSASAPPPRRPRASCSATRSARRRSTWSPGAPGDPRLPGARGACSATAICRTSPAATARASSPPPTPMGTPSPGRRSPHRAAQPDLTGFSHGTAGIGWSPPGARPAATGEARFGAAAESAFRYERRCFDPRQGNWPDFRGSQPGPDGAPAWGCSLAWCHGAPGIALSRAARLPADRLGGGAAGGRGRHRHHRARGAPDVGISGALGAISPSVTASPAMPSAPPWPPASGNGAGTGADLDLARFGVERYHADRAPWPCGVPGGGENPSLMLGLAGIGHFYLRLALPEPRPSIPGYSNRRSHRRRRPSGPLPNRIDSPRDPAAGPLSRPPRLSPRPRAAPLVGAGAGARVGGVRGRPDHPLRAVAVPGQGAASHRHPPRGGAAGGRAEAPRGQRPPARPGDADRSLAGPGAAGGRGPGEWPLWNDLAGAGMPLLGDPQSQTFEPLVLAALPLPLPAAVG